MNRTQAQAKCNPQAMEYEPKVSAGNWQHGASYDEALGFQSSCHGVSCLAHYCLIQGGDTVSRRECAREIARIIGEFDLDQIEIEIECWVNRAMTFEDIGLSESVAKKLLRLMSKPRIEVKNYPGITDIEKKRQKDLVACYALIDSMNPSRRGLLPFIDQANRIRKPVFIILRKWEGEWMHKLGEVDEE